MSDKKKDGGPAFPVDSTSTSGMSLRDYFAAKAMQAIIEIDADTTAGQAWKMLGGSPDDFPQSNSEVWKLWRIGQAEQAYEIADAMLETREK